MTDDAKKKPAVALILPPDGKFHSPDIWSVMHRQAGGFDLVIIDRSRGAAKILPAMAKAAVTLIRDDAAPLGAQLNEVARGLSNDHIVFFTDRVLPTHDHWLTRLTAPLAEPGAAAAFGRIITAPGGNYFIIEDLRKRYPEQGLSTAFTIDNCAIRRAALLRNPFPEGAVHDPAAVWRWRNGVAPVYVPEALAMQDSYLALKEVLLNARAFGADRAAAGKKHGVAAELAAALRELVGDVGYCIARRKPQYLWYPFLYRATIHWGICSGQIRGAR